MSMIHSCVTARVCFLQLGVNNKLVPPIRSSMCYFQICVNKVLHTYSNDMCRIVIIYIYIYVCLNLILSDNSGMVIKIRTPVKKQQRDIRQVNYYKLHNRLKSLLPNKRRRREGADEYINRRGHITAHKKKRRNLTGENPFIKHSGRQREDGRYSESVSAP